MTEHIESPSDDEALSALIDNSLSSERAAALRNRLAREPALAARFAAMQRANNAFRNAYRDVVDEPLPERTLDLLRAPRASGGNVVELEARRRRRALPTWFPQAVAAGLALAVGLGLGFSLGQRSIETASAGLLAATGMVDPNSPLHEFLESVPSGAARALGTATAEARFTFRAIDGDWCRELTLTSATASNNALTCRRDGAWRIDLVGVAPATGELYRPASATDAPFQQAIDAVIDGDPLEPDAERALLDRAWQAD